MRGSPLLRFILLVIALAVTGLGLLRVTAARDPGNPPVPAEAAASQALPAVAFRLVLSAPAEAVEINTGRVVRPPLDTPLLSGSLELNPKNPHVALVVRWKTPAAAGEHRFAKLTLEIPGQDTFTHVFDADGDIDDFLELPFPAAK